MNIAQLRSPAMRDDCPVALDSPLGRPGSPLSPQERFDRSYLGEPNSGCWLWMMVLDGDGYGQLTLRRPVYRTLSAHRFSYELNVGPIPDGLCVLHRCDVPACVNPRHLFLGTKADNTRDMIAKGRHRSQKTAARRLADPARGRFSSRKILKLHLTENV